MSTRYKFRFGIGQAMIFIAFSALFLARTVSGNRHNYVYLTIINLIVGGVGIGVFAYNLRLSGWMWSVIVGYAAAPVLGVVGVKAISFLPSPPAPDAIYQVLLISQGIGSFLFVVGLAMTFRDIRMRLTRLEALPSSAIAGALHAPLDESA